MSIVDDHPVFCSKLLEGLKEDDGKSGSDNAQQSSLSANGGPAPPSAVLPLPGDQPERKHVGVGVDCCILPLRHGNLSLVQTTDFFYPLVEDPYVQGRIACANVLSDLYAMGVSDCDNVELICGIPTQLSESERDVVIGAMLEGFRDCAKEGGANVRGGQIAPNPWMMIGGVASSVCSNDEYDNFLF